MNTFEQMVFPIKGIEKNFIFAVLKNPGWAKGFCPHIGNVNQESILH